MKKALKTTLSVFFIMLFVSCSIGDDDTGVKNKKDPLIGSWFVDNTSNFFTFKSNGSWEVSGDEFSCDGGTITATWENVNSNPDFSKINQSYTITAYSLNCNDNGNDSFSEVWNIVYSEDFNEANIINGDGAFLRRK